jgi:diaminopimelate epimerase
MPDGANVDFIRIPRAWDEPLAIRTYERGVEDETWACGTGATASAICARIFLGAPDKISLLCASGDLLGIELSCRDNIVLGAHLTGPAKTSFTGVLELDGP